MTVNSLITVDVEAELDRLALRYARAGGLGIQVLNLIGGRAESLLERLPAPVRDRLGDGTEAALHWAMRAAQGSRGLVGDQPGWMNTAVTTAMGAAGGFGGLPTALAELPLTTTVLLRAIQGWRRSTGSIRRRAMCNSIVSRCFPPPVRWRGTTGRIWRSCPPGWR